MPEKQNSHFYCDLETFQPLFAQKLMVAVATRRYKSGKPYVGINFTDQICCMHLIEFSLGIYDIIICLNAPVIIIWLKIFLWSFLADPTIHTVVNGLNNNLQQAL